jgi:GT2 family glycosyltransferase
MLSRCAEGVLERTDYPDLELVVVDNGSVDPAALRVIADLGSHDRVRVLQRDTPFNFSTLINDGARNASGSVLVLLNDDTQVRGGGWLRELVAQASRPEIGLVGARLLYPTDEIQHAGIVMESGGPHHQFRLCDASEPGPSGELVLVRSVTALTAACVAIRRSVFEEIGGMDEDFAVAFGDIDLCLRVAARGYRLLCTPFAELYHFESASRGQDSTAAQKMRFAQEISLLRRRWETALHTDRYANPSLLFSWTESGAWGLPRPLGDRVMNAAPRSKAARLRRGASRVLHSTLTAPASMRPNPLFSADWYVASYPEVAGYRLGPYRHYRRHGVKEGRDPNRLFDTRWYLDRNPDVAASGMDPLDHYLVHGAEEGRDPGPGFSTLWYLSQNADVRSSGANPLLHYLRQGEREGRRPRP